MDDEFFKIWIRHFLKQVIKKEYFVLVSKNFAKIEVTKENRKKLGMMMDTILEILGAEGENPFLGVSKETKIDNAIMDHLPQE